MGTKTAGDKIMDEQARVESINKKVALILEEVLERLEDETLSADDFLAETYARLVAAYALGYSPGVLIENAQRAVERLNDVVEGMDE
jgi:hypothetical protein